MPQIVWVLLVSVATLIEAQDDECSQTIGGIVVNLSQVPNVQIDGTIAHPCLTVNSPPFGCLGKSCLSVGKLLAPSTAWTLIERDQYLIKFQVPSHQIDFRDPYLCFHKNIRL
jgi:hypothetical protein